MSMTASIVGAAPLGYYILVSADRPDEKSEEGVIIPAEGQKPKQRGVVVATGPDCPDNINPGTRVQWLHVQTENEVEYGGEKYLLMSAHPEHGDLALVFSDEAS